MKWPQELSRLLPLVRKYIIRYSLLSALKIISLLAIVNIPLQIIGGVFPENPSYGFIFIALNLATLSSSLIYFYLRRPKAEEIAAYLDKELGTKERIVTFMEYEKVNSVAVTFMKNEVRTFMGKVSLTFDWDMQKFKRQTFMACITIIVLIASIILAPQISQSIEREPGVKEKQQEVIGEIDDVLDELIEIDEDKYQELIEEIESLKEIALDARASEELELILKELEELLLKEVESQQDLLKDISELQDLLNSPDLENELKDNPLLKEELVDRLENLQNSNLNNEQSERLQQLTDEINTNPSEANLSELRELLEEIEESNQTTPLEELIGEQQGNMPGSGEEPGNGQEPGEGGEGPGSEEPGSGENPTEGEGQGEGNNGQEPGGEGSSPTGNDTTLPQDYVYIPSDNELILDGEEGEYTLRDIMRMNPNIITSPYKDIYTGYHREAITSVTRSDIPKPLEDHVRKYFQSIAP